MAPALERVIQTALETASEVGRPGGAFSQARLEAASRALPALLFWAVPPTGLLILLYRDRIPFLRFRRKGEVREPALWGGGEVLVAVSVFFLSQVLASLVLGPLEEARVLGEGAAFLAIAAISSGATCWVIVRLVRQHLGQPLATLGLVGAPCVNFATVLGVFALLFLPLQAVAALWICSLDSLFGLGPREQQAVEVFRDRLAAGDVPAVASLVLSGVLLAPLGEELLFRGLFFGWLRARWGPAAAACVSSLVFASIHFSVTGFAPLLVLGLALASIYERTGSLYFSMLFHSVFNGIMFTSLLLFSRS